MENFKIVKIIFPNYFPQIIFLVTTSSFKNCLLWLEILHNYCYNLQTTQFTFYYLYSLLHKLKFSCPNFHIHYNKNSTFCSTLHTFTGHSDTIAPSSFFFWFCP